MRVMQHRPTSFSSSETRPPGARTGRHPHGFRRPGPTTSSSDAQAWHEVNYQVNDTLTEAEGGARDPNAARYDGTVS
jgi:hypothetical protein